MKDSDINRGERHERILQVKCRSCGGIMRYSPEKHQLECIYCGTVIPLDHSRVETPAYDYYRYAEQGGEYIPDVDEEEFTCAQCGAVSKVEDNIVSMPCPFCGSSLIVRQEHIARDWHPDTILPFYIGIAEAQDKYKKWIHKKWFAPSGLRRNASAPSHLKGYFLPYWAYDASTSNTYWGQRGDDYEVEVKRDGKTEREKRTRWRDVSGEVSLDFSNIMICGLQTMPEGMNSEVQRWDIHNCVKYREEYLSGFYTEVYTRNFVDAMSDAERYMYSEIEDAVERDIGGDHQRVDNIDTDYSNVMFKLFMLPVWISSYQYNGKSYQFVVNGRTGVVSGKYPVSIGKVLAVIAIVALIVFCIYYFYFR